MLMTWMLLCLLLRPSATQNPAPEGGKLPQMVMDTIDPMHSKFDLVVFSITIEKHVSEIYMEATTERVKLKTKI